MIGFCTIINPSNPSAATIAIRPNIEVVYGEISSTSRAVVGGVNINTNSPAAGVAAISKGPSAGIYGQSDKGPTAHFEGNVEVAGDIKLLGADCAKT